VVVTDDRDLALLAGDRLYALGLERLAAGGHTDEVAILADIVALVARLHAPPAWAIGPAVEGAPAGGTGAPEDAAGRTAALWEAAAAALGQGATSPAAELLREVRRGALPDSNALRAVAVPTAHVAAGPKQVERTTRTDRVRAPGRYDPPVLTLPSWDDAGASHVSDRRPAQSKYTIDRGIPGAFEGETVTRRRLMVFAANATAGIAIGGVALSAAGFAAGQPFVEVDTGWHDVGPLDEIPNDTYVPRVITLDPKTGQVGKSTVYVRQRNENVDKEPKDQWNEIIAISSRCMHMGCPARYVQAAKNFVCPCHGGVYDFRGEVAAGPPVRPLDRFYTRVVDGRVQVGKRFSVNSQIERFSPRPPGQPLDGIGQYLFPSRPTMRKLPGT
jgi:Rieske Fe-S protein